MTSQPSVATTLIYPLKQARLGQISFINCLPVALPIEKGHVAMTADIVYGDPNELNSGYLSCSLDIGAMSSSFYLSQRNFELVPNLSISATGAVGSVLFFSKVSPHKLNGAKILVPQSSSTSVNLLKVLLAEQLGIKINCVVSREPSLKDPEIAGALVIGDYALAIDDNWSNQYWRADLAQWWLSQSGLPMVFAVWAARSDWAKTNESEFAAISEKLVISAKIGLSALFPQVVAVALTRTKLQPHQIQRYFQQQLDFRLTEKHLDGLRYFHKLCKRHELSPLVQSR